MSESDSVEMLRRDHSQLASTVGNLVTLMGSLDGRMGMLEKLVIEIQTDREVRKERDRNLNERLTRIEKSIDDLVDKSEEGQKQVVNLAKYILGALFSIVLGAGWAFVSAGGLNVVSR